MSDILNVDGKLITKLRCPSLKEISHPIDTISKPIPVHFRVGSLTTMKMRLQYKRWNWQSWNWNLEKQVVQIVLLLSTSNMGVIFLYYGLKSHLILWWSSWKQYYLDWSGLSSPLFRRRRKRIHLAWAAIVVLTSVLTNFFQYVVLDRLTQLCKHQLFQLLQTAYQKGMPIKEAIIATKEAVY